MARNVVPTSPLVADNDIDGSSASRAAPGPAVGNREFPSSSALSSTSAAPSPAKMSALPTAAPAGAGGGSQAPPFDVYAAITRFRNQRQEQHGDGRGRGRTGGGSDHRREQHQQHRHDQNRNGQPQPPPPPQRGFDLADPRQAAAAAAALGLPPPQKKQQQQHRQQQRQPLQREFDLGDPRQVAAATATAAVALKFPPQPQQQQHRGQQHRQQQKHVQQGFASFSPAAARAAVAAAVAPPPPTQQQQRRGEEAPPRDHRRSSADATDAAWSNPPPFPRHPHPHQQPPRLPQHQQQSAAAAFPSQFSGGQQNRGSLAPPLLPDGGFGVPERRRSSAISTESERSDMEAEVADGAVAPDREAVSKLIARHEAEWVDFSPSPQSSAPNDGSGNGPSGEGGRRLTLNQRKASELWGAHSHGAGEAGGGKAGGGGFPPDSLKSLVQGIDFGLEDSDDDSDDDDDMVLDQEEGENALSPSLPYHPSGQHHHRRKRSVRFAGPTRDVHYHHIARSEYTECELRSSWYDNQDQEEIQLDIIESARAVRRINKSRSGGGFRDEESRHRYLAEETSDACSRGLEHIVDPAVFRERKAMKQRGVDAVLDEQDDQIGRMEDAGWDVGTEAALDDDAVAAASRAASGPCRVRASDMGTCDAAVADLLRPRSRLSLMRLRLEIRRAQSGVPLDAAEALQQIRREREETAAVGRGARPFLG